MLYVYLSSEPKMNVIFTGEKYQKKFKKIEQNLISQQKPSKPLASIQK